MKLLLKYAAILLILQIICGCAFQQNYFGLHTMLNQGKCQEAVSYIESSESKYGSNSRLLFLLDSGVINMQCGNYEQANRFFHQAEQLAEQLWTESISKNLVSYVTNDYALPYAGEDFERVFINLFSALCYLELGKKEEALVECRKMDSLLSMYNDKYGEKKNVYKEDAFARYLSGIIYESDSDTDDAYIDYAKSFKTFRDYAKNYAVSAPDILKEDLYRSAARAGRKQDVKELLGSPKDIKITKPKEAEKKGKLVIIHIQGIVPEKVSRMFSVPTKGGVVSIAFPEYRLSPCFCDKSKFTVVSDKAEFVEANGFLVEDVGKIAIKSLEDRKARIWAKAVARAVAKQIAIKSIARGVTKTENSLLESVLNLANNAVLEKADTRSWMTLPSKIYMSRLFLEPGKYKIYMEDCSNQKHLKKELNIKPAQTEYVVVYSI